MTDVLTPHTTTTMISNKRARLERVEPTETNVLLRLSVLLMMIKFCESIFDEIGMEILKNTIKYVNTPNGKGRVVNQRGQCVFVRLSKGEIQEFASSDVTHCGEKIVYILRIRAVDDSHSCAVNVSTHITVNSLCDEDGSDTDRRVFCVSVKDFLKNVLAPLRDLMKSSIQDASSTMDYVTITTDGDDILGCIDRVGLGATFGTQTLDDLPMNDVTRFEWEIHANMTAEIQITELNIICSLSPDIVLKIFEHPRYGQYMKLVGKEQTRFGGGIYRRINNDDENEDDTQELDRKMQTKIESDKATRTLYEGTFKSKNLKHFVRSVPGKGCVTVSINESRMKPLVFTFEIPPSASFTMFIALNEDED